MDKKKSLNKIISSKIIVPTGKEYFYPDIPSKVSDKIKKHFDPYMNTDDIVAFADSTLMRSSKGGLVFTLSGFYSSSLLEKTYYINYRDISNIKVIPDKNKKSGTNAKMKIELSDGSEIEISSPDFDKESLKDVLLKCKKETKGWRNIFCSIRPSGEVSEPKLTSSEKKKCHTIIHGASTAAAGIGAGMAQLPASDSVALAALQTTMVTSLAAVFDIGITDGAAKGIVSGMAASFTGRAVSQFLVGWMPGVGNAVNATTAAGLTEAVGWAAAAHFAYIKRQREDDYQRGFRDCAKALEALYNKLWAKMK